MTTREAIDKVAAWLHANGVQANPIVAEQTDFTPVVGFTPALEVEWKGAFGKIQFYADEIAHLVNDDNGETLRACVLLPVQAITGADITSFISWSDFNKPPAMPANPLEVVGPQVPEATVALYLSPDRPLLIPGRKYFEIANGAYPTEGSKYTSPGGYVYTVVSPNPFKRWLRL